MAKKEKRLKIEIESLPNGYALTVGKLRCMYFTVEELTAGYFSHVMLKQKDYLNTDFLKNLMTAAAAWPTVEDAITANAMLLDEKEQVEKKYKKAYRNIQSLEDHIEKLEKELRNIRGKYEESVIKLSAFKNIKSLK